MKLTHNNVEELCQRMSDRIVREMDELTMPRPFKIYPVPRGGVPVAYLLQKYLPWSARIVNDAEQAHIVVDDLIDSGKTRERYAGMPFYALIDKHGDYPGTAWIEFPWEDEDTSGADDIPRRLLQFIGEDPNRGGLAETPTRFLKAWQHWTSGYTQEPADILKVFEDGAENYDEMVLVRDIPVYSQCEHHLAPFFGVAHIAYIPNGHIVGLSKLSRLTDIYARRLQVQERLTNQIADALDDALRPKGVAVVIRCRHMCMESRGVCQQGHSTVTSAMRGVFLTNAAARAEYMGLIK